MCQLKLNYEKCFYSLECNENTILVRVFNIHEFKGYFPNKKKRKCKKDKRAKRMTAKEKKTGKSVSSFVF